MNVNVSLELYSFRNSVALKKDGKRNSLDQQRCSQMTVASKREERAAVDGNRGTTACSQVCFVTSRKKRHRSSMHLRKSSFKYIPPKNKFFSQEKCKNSELLPKTHKIMKYIDMTSTENRTADEVKLFSSHLASPLRQWTASNSF